MKLFAVTADGLFSLNLLSVIHLKSKEEPRLMNAGSFGGLEVMDGDFPIILTTSMGKDCVFLELRGNFIFINIVFTIIIYFF